MEDSVVITYNKCMANLNIEGHGSFTLNPEQTQALISWLEQNGVARTINSEGSNYDGKSLLNEGDTPSDPNKRPKGSGGSSDGTWDLDTTWI